MLQIKRVYEQYSSDDGFRVLVDRLWPRGISKETGHINLWLKEIAPTEELRKWFNHEVEKWEEFEKKYKKELVGNKEVISELRELLKKHKVVTLVYGAKDEEHNNAVVLKMYLG